MRQGLSPLPSSTQRSRKARSEGLCTLCVLTGLFFLFFDDARSGNYFALGVKIVGTLLCVLTGEWLYREKPAKAES